MRGIYNIASWCLFAVLVAVNLGGCSFVSESAVDGRKDEPAETKSIAITGVVNVEDVIGSFTPLASASVNLYKIQNRQETEIATTLSDDNGQFSFAAIDSTILTNGDQDYFYEIRVSSESDVLSAIVVADDSIDVVVDLSSTVVAKAMRYTLDDLSVDQPGLASKNTFRTFKKLLGEAIPGYRENVVSLATSVDTQSTVDVFAKTLIKARSISEQLSNQVFYESWWYGLKDAVVDESAWANYMRRLTIDACGPIDGYVPLPYGIAQVLGKAAKSGKQYTVSQVLNAYNESNENQIDLLIGEVLSRYKKILDGIVETEEKSASLDTRFSTMQHLFLLSRRQLSTQMIDENTKLDPDQALMLWLYIESDEQEIYLCRPKAKVLAESVQLLSNDKRLIDASILEAQIYHVPGNESGVCKDEGMFAFHGEIYVNAPAKTDEERLHSVRVSSTDITSLYTDTFETATAYLYKREDDHVYAERETDACVWPDTPVTYTIKARLFDLSERKMLVNTSHWSIPSFDVAYDGIALSRNSAHPTVVTAAQPVFTFGNEEELLATMDSAPEGASIRYKYSAYHEKVGKSAGTALSKCGAITRSPVYHSEQLMMPFACEIGKCASLEGLSSDSVQCRISVRGQLVDEAGRILSMSDEKFGYYCVDIDGNGSCE